MSMIGRGPTTTGPIGGGGGGGALLIVVGVIVIVVNFPTVIAIVVFLASGLWTLIASIAVGAAYSVPIAFFGVLSGDFGFPAFTPAISGIIAGAVIAWLRMAFRTKEKYDPLLSSLFSIEGLSEGGWQFLWRFLADIAVGYLVMLAFGMIHFVPTTDHQFTLSIHNIGSGLLGGGGFGGPPGGGGSGFLSEFLVVLAALLFAAIIIGALCGAAIGAGLGLGLCSTHVLRGMAQGATIHVLLGRRKGEDQPKNFIGYIFLGAFSGAVEGALVGVLCGVLTDWGYL
jgi:hypothetical protein